MVSGRTTSACSISAPPKTEVQDRHLSDAHYPPLGFVSHDTSGISPPFPPFFSHANSSRGFAVQELLQASDNMSGKRRKARRGVRS